MTHREWVFAGGMAILTAVALWYQVRYYKLVDDLIDALTQDPKE